MTGRPVAKVRFVFVRNSRVNTKALVRLCDLVDMSLPLPPCINPERMQGRFLFLDAYERIAPGV